MRNLNTSMSGLNSVPLSRRPTWEGQLGPIGRCEYPQLHPSHHHIVRLTVCVWVYCTRAGDEEPHIPSRDRVPSH